MMHGRGKSELCHTERLAAEPTERRAGAKGSWTSKSRAGHTTGESVSQALERI